MAASMTHQEVVAILTGQAMADAELFAAARSVRDRVFSNRVVVRGVIEITNNCRVNCTFCPMRRDNARLGNRFILTNAEIAGAAKEVLEAGINVVFLQGGEIPQTTRLCSDAIVTIREEHPKPIEILLNLGNKARAEYTALKRSGADSYILKHETTNLGLYSALKGEPLAERLRCLRDLIELGFNVGTGLIVGIPGQSIADLAIDILHLAAEPVKMLSASPFVPASDTPLAQSQPASVAVALRALAVMRLIRPDVLIPSVSALEMACPGGQGAGIDAGANVLTVNFTPSHRTGDYRIYGENRYVVPLQQVQGLIHARGMEIGASPWV